MTGERRDPAVAAARMPAAIAAEREKLEAAYMAEAEFRKAQALAQHDRCYAIRKSRVGVK